MIQKKNNIKSVSPALVAILLAALVVAVSFIYWQNFINKPVTYEKLLKIETASPQVATKQKPRQLVLEKWNVYIPLKENSYYYQPGEHSTVSSDDEVYMLSTKSLRVACGTQKATIGSLERVLNTEENKKKKTVGSHVDGTKVIGEYLFVFTRPRTVCSDSLDVITLQENATSEFTELLDSLQVIK